MAVTNKYSIKDRYLQAMIKEFTDYGEVVLNYAYETRDFKNRTFNLRDSYASAVFYNGQMVNGTMRTLGTPMATEGKKFKGRILHGRNEASDYLRNRYKPTSMGLSLVVVAAMPYGEILEKGGGNLRYKYKVISGANSLLRSLGSSFSAKFGVRKHGITITDIQI